MKLKFASTAVGVVIALALGMGGQANASTATLIRYKYSVPHAAAMTFARSMRRAFPGTRCTYVKNNRIFGCIAPHTHRKTGAFLTKPLLHTYFLYGVVGGKIATVKKAYAP